MATSLQLCRFCIRTGSDNFGGRCVALPFRKPISIRCSGDSASSSSVAVDPDNFDAKAFRHNLTRSKNYNRKGFGHKEETLELMSREYTSDIIKKLKENRNEYTWGNVTVNWQKHTVFAGELRELSKLLMKPENSFPMREFGLPMKLSTIQLLISG